MDEIRDIVVFETEDRAISMIVTLSKYTVWLNQNQMTELFQRDQSVISRHITNVIKENEIDIERNMHYEELNLENGRIMRRAQNQLETKQILSVIERYTLEYEECKDLIQTMDFGLDSTLFGSEKDDFFKSSSATIYQTFNRVELYPSIEEKAAQLLYLITKNH